MLLDSPCHTSTLDSTAQSDDLVDDRYTQGYCIERDVLADSIHQDDHTHCFSAALVAFGAYTQTIMRITTGE